jgi:fructokinase
MKRGTEHQFHKSNRITTGPSFETSVCDTVGAGDAFMAAMITSLSESNFNPEAALHRATALGSWVASCAGAQPGDSKFNPFTPLES